MKVEELLGEKNETVEGIVPFDINFHMLKMQQTQATEQQQTQQQQEKPQPVLDQQQPQPQQPPHHQKTQLQPQPQPQQQSQLQPQQYFEDGSIIEYSLIEPETSMGLPICSTPKKHSTKHSDDTLEYKAEKKKLKLEKQKLKILALRKKIELNEKLMLAKIDYYKSITDKIVNVGIL